MATKKSITSPITTQPATPANKLRKKDTLAMALSGYRSTAPYIRYLSELKKHLQYCKAHKLDPVIVYTQPNPINKHKKEGRHYE